MSTQKGLPMDQDLTVWSGDEAELAQWENAKLADLVGYIVTKYHREGSLAMARLEAQAAEAALLEGRTCPELLVIRDEVERFCTELRAHFRHEEHRIFPALLDLAEGRTPSVPTALLDPIRLLQEEHHSAAGLLDRIHDLTQGFQPPEAARAVQHRLYQAFQTLAESLYKHIYLENEVLFKRALP